MYINKNKNKNEMSGLSDEVKKEMGELFAYYAEEGNISDSDGEDIPPKVWIDKEHRSSLGADYGGIIVHLKVGYDEILHMFTVDGLGKFNYQFTTPSIKTIINTLNEKFDDTHSKKKMELTIKQELKNMYEMFTPSERPLETPLVRTKDYSAYGSGGQDMVVVDRINIDSTINLEAEYINGIVDLDVNYNKISKQFEAKGLGNFQGFYISDVDVDKFINEICKYFEFWYRVKVKNINQQYHTHPR